MEPPTLGLQYNTSATLFEVGLRGGRELARHMAAAYGVGYLYGNRVLRRQQCGRCCNHALGWHGAEGRFECVACHDAHGEEDDECTLASTPAGDPEAAAAAERAARAAASLGGTDARAAAELAALAALAPSGDLLRHSVCGVEVYSDPLNAAVAGLGASLWFASRVLADYVLRGPSAVPAGSRVVEVGAGCGAPALVLAARAGCDATLTDLPQLLPLLRLNAAHNSLAAGGGRPPAAVAPLVWGDAAQAAALTREGGDGRPFDVVLGADVAYDPDRHGDLLDTLAALAARRGAHRPAARVARARRPRRPHRRHLRHPRAPSRLDVGRRRHRLPGRRARGRQPRRGARGRAARRAAARLRPAAAAAVVTRPPSPVSATPPPSVAPPRTLEALAPAAGEGLATLSARPGPRPRYSLRHMASQDCIIAGRYN